MGDTVQVPKLWTVTPPSTVPHGSGHKPWASWLPWGPPCLGVWTGGAPGPWGQGQQATHHLLRVLPRGAMWCEGNPGFYLLRSPPS